MKRILWSAVLLLLLGGCRQNAAVFAPRGSSVELPVIMYHSLVKQDSAAAQYVCPVSRVESDLRWLRDNGYRCVTLQELIAFANGKAALPPKPVLITLDDGYRNNLTLLPALLEQYDAHAVLSVVGEYADIYTASGEDGSPHSCMSWEDLSRAAASPRLELANHAYYFHRLTGRKGSAQKPGESRDSWQAAFTADTRALQKAMADRGLPPPVCYAYPFGQLTEGADLLLKEMGFQVSLTCNELRSVVVSGDPGSLLGLGRFNRDGRLSTEEYMARLLG